EVLTPSMHEHDAALPLLILKHSPHSERRRVILLLFGESTVERGDDVAEHRELAVRRIPRLPPITLKDPPLSGTGICSKRPDAMYGPSSALMRATSLAPKRSGHINAPSRPSNSNCAAVSRGTRPSVSNELPSPSGVRGPVLLPP